MTNKTYNVLFVCTGNSARSIIAEALMNELGHRRGFKAFSAGSHPKGEVHPMALRTIANLEAPLDKFHSKGWEEFATPTAPQMDFVFTVCDQAAGEACPVWPGQPMTAHWGVPDPVAVLGSEELRYKAFLETFVTLRRRIELLMALPLTSLDAIAIKREIVQIGKQ